MLIDEFAVIEATDSFLTALEQINRCCGKVAFVNDQHGRLIGTLSDGDIRRAFLSGAQISDAITSHYCTNYVYSTSPALNLELMATARERGARFIPIVNENNKIVEVVECDIDHLTIPRKETVVLMVGGLGTRLRPLTNHTPKPLLDVGGKPVLEIILLNLISHGFTKFIMSVNYKAEMIIDYFGDGADYGVTIQYNHEDKRLGTAGALSLLCDTLTDTFLVMNGDVISTVNFGQLIEFFDQSSAEAAVCVRSHEYTIPFGVVQTVAGKTNKIIEKPTEHVYINAGIYLLSPQHLEYLPHNEFFDMPELINKLLQDNIEIMSFPIHEPWIDIGSVEQYERARAEHALVGQH